MWRGDPEERTYLSLPGSLLRDNSSKMLIISVASVTFISKSCTRSFTEVASSFGTAWTDSMRSPVVEYVSGWGFFFFDRKKTWQNIVLEADVTLDDGSTARTSKPALGYR